MASSSSTSSTKARATAFSTMSSARSLVASAWVRGGGGGLGQRWATAGVGSAPGVHTWDWRSPLENGAITSFSEAPVIPFHCLVGNQGLATLQKLKETWRRVAWVTGIHWVFGSLVRNMLLYKSILQACVIESGTVNHTPRLARG